MTDLVERLREGIDCDPADVPRAENLMEEAADRIEGLEKKLYVELTHRISLHSQLAEMASASTSAQYDYAQSLAEKDKEIAELRHDLERYMDIANAKCNK